jgi:triosephosphate isomerase
MKKVAPIVIANWKANPDSLKMAKANFIAIKKIASQNKKVNVIVCPPVLFLESLKNNLKPISLGAQDFFPEPQGDIMV